MQGEAERALRCRPPSLPNRPHFDADSIDSAIPRPLAGNCPVGRSVDLWWVDIPGQERAFFTSAKDAWHHAGEAAYQQLAAAQVFRGTFALRPASVEHTGDFTAMAESFRNLRA